MKQIETLIGMTEFVKLEHEKYINDRVVPANVGLHLYLSNTHNFANFLSQPPKLGHFIPCDENDAPLGMPIIYDGMDSDALLDEKKYFEAVDRILFEGAIFRNIQPSIDYNYYEINGVKIFTENNHGKFYSNFKTIESLTPYNLKLTQTAKNRIYDENHAK